MYIINRSTTLIKRKGTLPCDIGPSRGRHMHKQAKFNIVYLLSVNIRSYTLIYAGLTLLVSYNSGHFCAYETYFISS